MRKARACTTTSGHSQAAASIRAPSNRIPPRPLQKRFVKLPALSLHCCRSASEYAISGGAGDLVKMNSRGLDCCKALRMVKMNCAETRGTWSI